MLKKLLVLVAILALGVRVQAARITDDRPMYEIHSMLMFNFLKYIEWPASAQNGDFVIAVVGDDDVYNTLSKYYSARKINGQNVVIKNYGSVESIQNAHVVYLASGKSNQFDDLKAKFSGKPTLLITDHAGLGKKGSNINFRVISGKLKFEINKEAFNQAKLKVASQLEAMAIMI